MPHLDHDRLVFLALGESEAGHGETDHLDACVSCRGELETLRHIAGLGADTQGLRDLPDPPAHVWAGVLAEIDAAEKLPSLAEAHRQGLAGVRPQPLVEEPPGLPHRPPSAVTGDRPEPRRQRSSRPDGERAAPGPAPRSRRGRRWPRWATTVVTATAAAVIAMLGTVAVLGDRDGPAPRQTVLASAPLAAYGSTPKDANGAARVFADGRLHLHVANLPDVSGYYEVWLINPTTMEMFSVGVLRGSSGDALLPLPPNVDLQAYSVVDVSAEEYDNRPAHSGDSLLRGTLTG
ncbi:anti-sigma factor [Micromonospora sp. WMMD987]|uniref:anti-sigma factor n=1 Tax=Micromonospora sp. WMMD987 TaxID=3016089 RepID=UPI00249B0247|nr:anti-sigma factor [Micromonospora sp. WMMD987]WFE96747.1 anti-sigma factor [Micromonospora sp. WMMD987]